MERPAKRQRISGPEPEPEIQEEAVILPEQHFNCTELHTRNIDRQRKRQVRPTPTLNEHDLRRRAMLDGSRRNGRDPYLKGQAAELVPRAPDTTVTASAIDINVQNGATTIANTIVVQATDATVVSFASIGVLTVTPDTASASISSDSSTATDSSSTDSASSSLPTLSFSQTGSSLPAGITTSTSLTPLNSTTVSTTEDITTTITLTSTLNVSFDGNGTVVTISNPSNSSTATSSESITSSRSRHSTGIIGTASITSASAFSATSGITASGSNAAGASSTGAAGVGGVSASATGAAPSSSTTAASSGGGGGSSPTTPAVVGGAVGGVAGLALVLLILLAIFRWYRKRLANRGQLPEQIAARSVAGDGPGAANQMSQRSSGIGFLAGAFGHFRPQSSTTTATAPSTVPDSERGFQRIAGRKIAPILGPGGGSGDQYGGNYGAFEPEAAAAVGTSAPVAGSSAEAARNLADSSFYRDSQGFYGGKGEEAGPGFVPPPPRNPARDAGATGSRDFAENGSSVYETPAEEASEGYAAMRPSPARTPVMTSPSASSVRLPIQQNPTMEPGAPPTPAIPPHLAPRRQDGVGRSLPSQDGSRGSRFTESV